MFPGSFVSGDQVFGGKAPSVCGRFLPKLKLKIVWINKQNLKESRKNSWTFMEKWSDFWILLDGLIEIL